jgi:hypothetical protein
MECCSPDVGDCQKCHPELWIQKGGSYCNWIPKGAIGKAKPGNPGGQRGLPLFNRTRSKHARRRARTQKKRTV